MAVNSTVFRGKKVITIDGKVDAFYVNAIKPEHIKTYSGAKGPWTPSHRYSLVVDGERISLGMGDKDGVSDRQVIQAKDNDGKYHAIVKGLEVSVEVTENGEYQGKTQYQSSNTKVVVLDASGAEAPQQKAAAGGGQQQAYQAKPKDMSGIQLGHSVNGAMNFLITWGVEASNENIIGYGKKVHGATEKLKKEYKAANPDMSDYDASASVGNAILNACKLVGTDSDFEDGVYSIAKDLLENVVKPLGEFIRAPKVDNPPAKVTRSAPKKVAATKAKPVKEVFPPLDEDDFADTDSDDDESAPF